MPRGITEQDVFEAADQLLVRGQRPTIERVRLALGTGSPNTVNRMLDAWWATLAKRMATKDIDALPASLIELCQRLYTGLRTEAAREAEVAAAVLRQSIDQERSVLERQRMELAQEKQGVAVLMESLRADFALVSAENAKAAGRIASLEASVAAERARATDAVSHLNAALAGATRDREAAEQEIERVRSQWEGNERRWLAEIDRLRTEVKQLRSAREKDAKVSEQRFSESAELRAEIKRLTTERRTLENALSKEREARIGAEAELVGIRRSRFPTRQPLAKRKRT